MGFWVWGFGAGSVLADLLRVAALFKGAGEHHARDLGELYRTRQEKRGINLAVFEEKMAEGRPPEAIIQLNFSASHVTKPAQEEAPGGWNRLPAAGEGPTGQALAPQRRRRHPALP